jgi:hypothetical protein
MGELLHLHSPNNSACRRDDRATTSISSLLDSLDLIQAQNCQVDLTHALEINHFNAKDVACPPDLLQSPVRDGIVY